MVEHLIDLAGRAGHWGYLVIFVVILLECQAGFGFFMPGETLVLASGFLAGQGVFDLDVLVLVVALGAMGGDSVGYELGRHLGRGWLERRGGRWGVTAERLEKIDRFILDHGGKSVFLSHFSHLFRPLMPFMAGSHRMPYGRFLVFNALGCLLWAGITAGLGYLFGDHWQLLEKWLGRAGLLAGALILAVVGFVWLWKWLVGNRDELMLTWKAFLDRPRVRAFRHHFDDEIRFLQNRLTPGGYLGLHLTVGVVIILLSCWWFGGIVEDILSGDPLLTVDHRVAVWFHQHAAPEVTGVVKALTFFGSPAFVAVSSVLVALGFAWRRHWYRVLGFVLVMGGGALLNVGLKHLFHRLRPAFEQPLVIENGFSFPSGHTMGATLFYGFLAVALARTLTSWRLRILALLAGVFIVLLIGFSRIYLGAHFLSDVMGAMAAGIAWLAVGMTASSTLRKARER